MPKPKIAVMLDENTSRGGTHYETHKDYFSAIDQAGGVPYGIPYLADMVDPVINEFDGFFSIGGGVCFPPEWYQTGQTSPFPPSERTAIEVAIMEGFLAADKPVLGACNGMQILAALHGCRLRSDLENTVHTTGPHSVTLIKGSRLAQIVGAKALEVNSRHREGVAEISDQLRVSAVAPDGIIEAIEVPNKRYALGYQWHQENFWREDHAGNLILAAFVASAEARR